MAFSSMTFLFGFLPAVLLCCFLIPAQCRTGRNLVLLVFSLAFYAWGGLRLLPEALRMQRASGVALVAAELAERGERPSAGELVPNYLRLSQAERERMNRN